jgi:hypothetical protein
MEQQDFTPIGGNWQQDAAYSLRQIIGQASELLQKFDENGNQIINVNVNPTPVTVNPTPVSTEVILTQNITLPREIQFVHNPLPLITPTSNTTFKLVKNYHRPAPRIIDVDKMNAYSRVCGSYNPINDGYSYCMQCVDAWLVANQDGFLLKDLTRAGTGCTTKKPKRCCKPNGMPY